MEIKDFESVASRLQEMGVMPPKPEDNRVYVKIPDAKDILNRGINWATRGNAKWLPEYNGVAEWLSDNKGKGLIMFGNCGRGKSLLGWYVLPAILNYWCHKVVTCTNAQDMNANADKLLDRHIIYIDDIGTESVSVQFGNRRTVFPELVDTAERKGKLLIISTNLTLKEITSRYGERISDRLKAITSQVLFLGESLR